MAKSKALISCMDCTADLSLCFQICRLFIFLCGSSYCRLPLSFGLLIDLSCAGSLAIIQIYELLSERIYEDLYIISFSSILNIFIVQRHFLLRATCIKYMQNIGAQSI